ncbi:TonB-dependent siderophore receptor [Achromobacter seleniivolatilans]|uniref:TonB-dependent siderophore receptor n=1 Tax=Achromobacter seleniivolatilans TaxID=3047478 RepID=A0ABY9M409_9BURK|nr:TonB-dependent siderophore receptor [Achromobacter sp. R39]WMD21734.1 TonB-dependent siderophore receptor [Achromobacter sp. R39]
MSLHSRRRASTSVKLLPARRWLCHVAFGVPVGTALFSLASVQPVQAQEVAARQQYAIAAGPVRQVLLEFGRQSGVMVGAEPALIADVRSPGLRGAYGLRDGLSALLAGTGLEAVAEESGAYRLRRAPAAATGTAVLEPVRVVGQTESAWGPVVGVAPKRSATGTKTDASILEIPQTVNVVSAAEITTRGAKTVAQALRYTPGVNVNGYTDSNMIADEVDSRGFAPAPLYLDGTYLPYAGSLGGALQIDPYLLERVEVLKGPASVLYGQNQPGGLINLVSKRPSEETLREVRFGVGSYGRVESALDLTGPANADGNLLYRVTAVANGGNEQIDYKESRRLLIAPSLTWKPSAATSLTLYTQLQRDGGVPDYQPLPAIGTVFAGPDGKRINRDIFTGQPGYNDFYRRQYVLGSDLSHKFSEQAAFRQTIRYVDVRDNYRGFYLNRFVQDADGNTDYSQASRTKLDWGQHNSVISVDNNLELKGKTGALDHTVLVGLDYRHFSRKYTGYNNYAATPLNLYAPDYNVAQPDTPLTTQWDNSVDQVGLYLQDQVKLDRFVLTMGGRYDWAKINNKDLLADTKTRRDDSAFSGRVGLAYVAENGVAPYISYSESFLPVIGTNFAGESFKPTTGKQVEIGVKYQPVGSDTLITLAAFEIRQKNMSSEDFDHPGYEVQNGGVRSKGVELEIKSQPIERLDVIAGLTYLNPTSTPGSYNEGKRLAALPTWAASLWTNYRLSGDVLGGLEVGAGVRWTGSAFGDSANTFRTPAFAVVDASLRYDLAHVSPTLRGATASLTVQNLFDKDYVSSCNYSFGCYYGKARSMMANVTYRW